MGRTTGRRVEFRVIHESGDASLFDLHQAYWSGKFGKRGRSRVEGTPPGLDEPCEASRDNVSQSIGWGSLWLPAEIRKMSSNRQRWSAMARVSRLDFNDFADWWLSAFGRFTIPQCDLDAWLEARLATKDDHIRRKIEGDRAFKLRFRWTPEYGGYVKYPYGAPQRESRERRTPSEHLPQPFDL